ncbi:MAG TPA: DUF1574 family protein [bacterium]|nr:DUF1574 family protein [bacterium]HPN31661.1 DUF1574 family protein [bacterium]
MNVSTFIKGFSCLFAAFILFIAANYIFSVFYIPEKQTLEIKFDCYKKNPEKFDALILGSSRVMRGVITERFNEIITNQLISSETEANNIVSQKKINAFNFGVKAAQPHILYLILKKALQSKNNIKWVLVNLDYFGFNISEEGNLSLLSQLDSFGEKKLLLKFFWYPPNETKAAFVMAKLFPLYRYKDRKLSWFLEKFTQKKSIVIDDVEYTDNGTNKNFDDSRADSETLKSVFNVFLSKNKKYKLSKAELFFLERIISLCKKSGIKLAFFRMPVEKKLEAAFESKVSKIYNEQIAFFTKKYDVAFWDLNFENNYNFEDFMFFDAGHLNKTGAELATDLLAYKAKAVSFFKD